MGTPITPNKIFVTCKSREWFEENAHIDDAGDFWPTESLQNQFDKKCNFSRCIYSIFLANKITEIFEYRLDDLAWGVEKVVTEETDPEYFV